jgi:hypothetical protein
VFDHSGSAVLYGIPKFAASLMAMDTLTDLVASVKISEGSGPYGIAWDRLRLEWTCHSGEDVAYNEPHLGIQTQSAGVVAGMHQPHPQPLSRIRSVQHCLHKMAANSTVLHRGINGDRPQSSYGRAFIEKITANNAAI